MKLGLVVSVPAEPVVGVPGRRANTLKASLPGGLDVMRTELRLDAPEAWNSSRTADFADG
jgi:hypothetical protein